MGATPGKGQRRNFVAHVHPGRRVGAGWPLAGLLGLAVAGCTVGPDFEPPQPLAVTEYRAAPQPAVTAAAELDSNPDAGKAQRFAPEGDIPAQWWQLFESEALDALVHQALSDSPNLAQARARLVRAEELLQARTGASRYPSVDVGVSANRIGVESDAFENPALGDELPFTVASATLGVSYALDLFGRNRRELEALSAAVDYERFELEAARLALAGRVVAAAIEGASLRRQITATETIVAILARQLEILEQLESLGAVPQLDVVLLGRELAATRGNLPALHERLEQNQHRLAVYLGQPPGAEVPALQFGSDLRLPGELPLSLPSDLARQRPDIRAAEALLHEASARVGVATANVYPQIMLSATTGGISIPPLLDGTAAFGLLAASLAQPLFNGGSLEAEKRAQQAAFDQAGAAYREVVLGALMEVADVLVSLEAAATTLRERARAARLAQSAYDITANRYEAGAVSLLALLDAERQLAVTTQEETLAIRDRFVDTASLLQALGGGWWNTDTSQP